MSNCVAQAAAASCSAALGREPLLLGRGVGVASRLPAAGAVLRREPAGEACSLVGGAVGQVVIHTVGAGVLHGPVRRHTRGIPFDGRYVRGRAADLGLQIECLSSAVGVAACVVAQGRARCTIHAADGGGPECLAVVSGTLPPSVSSQRVLRMASVAALAMATGALEGWGRCNKVVPGKWRDLSVRVSWSTAQPAVVSCLTRVTA